MRPRQRIVQLDRGLRGCKVAPSCDASAALLDFSHRLGFEGPSKRPRSNAADALACHWLSRWDLQQYHRMPDNRRTTRDQQVLQGRESPPCRPSRPVTEARDASTRTIPILNGQ